MPKTALRQSAGKLLQLIHQNGNLNTFANSYDLNGQNVYYLVDPLAAQSSENLGAITNSQDLELDVSVDLSKAPAEMSRGEYVYRVFLQYLKDKYHLNYSIDDLVSSIKSSTVGLTFKEFSEEQLKNIGKSSNPILTVALTGDYLKLLGVDLQKLIHIGQSGNLPAGAYTIVSDGMNSNGSVSRETSSNAGGINYAAPDDDNTFAPSMAGRDEVNRITIDFVKEFGNIIRDIVQGMIDTAIQGIATNNIGVNPTTTPVAYNLIKDHYLTLPKLRYESEMMRRNIYGVVDGAGIQAGDFIDEGTAVIAPLVIGEVFTSFESGEIVPSSIAGSRPTNSVWNIASYTERGRVVEQTILGRPANIAGNFPIIDDFANGTATSIKSINLLDKSYQKTSYLKGVLNKFAEKLSGFNGRNWGGFRIPPQGQQINQRVLLIALEKDAASLEQQQVISEFLQTVRQNYPNVTVDIRYIP